MTWHAKRAGGYGYTTAEALDNAKEVCNILMPLGFTLAACCAVLGNIAGEGEFNPWRWENDNILNYGDPQIDTSRVHGYGLVQFTPSGKYINSAIAKGYKGYAPNFNNLVGNPNDGHAQMLFMHYSCMNMGEYIVKSTYPLTYTQFRAAEPPNYEISYLTRVWFENYERGTWSTVRATAAAYFWEALQGYEPVPTGGNIPPWLLKKIIERTHRNVRF